MTPISRLAQIRRNAEEVRRLENRTIPGRRWKRWARRWQPGYQRRNWVPLAPPHWSRLFPRRVALPAGAGLLVEARRSHWMTTTRLLLFLVSEAEGRRPKMAAGSRL